MKNRYAVRVTGLTKVTYMPLGQLVFDHHCVQIMFESLFIIKFCSHCRLNFVNLHKNDGKSWENVPGKLN